MVPSAVCLRRRLEAKWLWVYTSRDVAAAGGTATWIFNLDFWKSRGESEAVLLGTTSLTVDEETRCLCFRFLGEDGEGGFECFLFVDIASFPKMDRKVQNFDDLQLTLKF